MTEPATLIGAMRGLTLFITDLRNGASAAAAPHCCVADRRVVSRVAVSHAGKRFTSPFFFTFFLSMKKNFFFLSTLARNKEEEDKRVHKEMAHIRQTFKEANAKKLDGYNRKKVSQIETVCVISTG